MSNAERLMAALAPIFGEGELKVDNALIRRIGDSLDEIRVEEISGMMMGDSSFTTEFEGREGLEATWSDWLETFTRVTLEMEAVEEIGDNVLTLVNQVGTTRHGVDMKQPSAAVWKFRDGLLTRVEFFLDRDRARESAARPA
jgi:ketosteroid isomerase-like protein